MTSYWPVVPGVIALLAYALASAPANDERRWPGTALIVGWIAHAVSIAVDVSGIGSAVVGARFGFAPALSITSWLVLAVYAVEGRFVPLPHARRALALLGIVAVALAIAFPGELRPHATSPWAPLHWVLGIASYGLFGAAVLHAVLLNAADRQMRPQSGALASAKPVVLPLLRLERLTFQFVAAGFVVLSATLMLGWWSAAGWRWDHKSVLSVLGWVVFAGLLVGRTVFGWRGRRATRWLYAGAALLLLAYVGSRFVLEVLLHRPPPS
jgi:ABC-type uncharacterized transport system permease subunit